MSELVNLRIFRKRKQRDEKAALAAANRAAFGRPKSEQEMTSLKRDTDSKRLDAHKREDQ